MTTQGIVMTQLAVTLLILSSLQGLDAAESDWHGDPDSFLCTWLITEPYAWSPVQGTLPTGLAVRSDGRITGVVAEDCPLAEFPFSVQVTDAAGETARADLAVTVRERPNRWVEECGLIGL